MSWTMEQMKYLLNLYEDHPTMSNFIGLNFVNQFEKERGLKEITKQMQKVRPKTTPNEVKAQLESLISQFKEEKQKEVSLREKGEKYQPTLWFYKQMSSIDAFYDIFSESLGEESLDIIKEPGLLTSEEYSDSSKIQNTSTYSLFSKRKRAQMEDSDFGGDINRKSIKMIGGGLVKDLKKEKTVAENFVDYIARELSTLHPKIICDTRLKIVNIIYAAQAKSLYLERSAAQGTPDKSQQPQISSSTPRLLRSSKLEHTQRFHESDIISDISRLVITSSEHASSSN